jgi:hypothetical protein
MTIGGGAEYFLAMRPPEWAAEEARRQGIDGYFTPDLNPGMHTEAFAAVAKSDRLSLRAAKGGEAISSMPCGDGFGRSAPSQ